MKPILPLFSVSEVIDFGLLFIDTLSCPLAVIGASSFFFLEVQTIVGRVPLPCSVLGTVVCSTHHNRLNGRHCGAVVWFQCGLDVVFWLIEGYYISVPSQQFLLLKGEKCVLKKSLVDIISQFIAYRYFIFPPKKFFF